MRQREGQRASGSWTERRGRNPGVKSLGQQRDSRGERERPGNEGESETEREGTGAGQTYWNTCAKRNRRTKTRSHKSKKWGTSGQMLETWGYGPFFLSPRTWDSRSPPLAPGTLRDTAGISHTRHQRCGAGLRQGRDGPWRTSKGTRALDSLAGLPVGPTGLNSWPNPQETF